MPMAYTIDQEAQLIRIEGKGLLTDEEIIKCVSSLRMDPNLKPDLNTLSDMRDIELGFSFDGVSRMLEIMESTADKRSKAKAAIVVNTDAAFGMGRMFELRSERFDPNFRVFRDMEAAHEWLGIKQLD